MREKDGRLYLIPVVLVNSDGSVVRVFDNAWKGFKIEKKLQLCCISTFSNWDHSQSNFVWFPLIRGTKLQEKAAAFFNLECGSAQWKSWEF